MIHTYNFVCSHKLFETKIINNLMVTKRILTILVLENGVSLKNYSSYFRLDQLETNLLQVLYYIFLVTVYIEGFWS